MREPPVAPLELRDMSQRYASSMAYLVEVARAVSEVRDIPALGRIIADAARCILGADGATFVLREGDMGHVVEQSAVDPVWKGRRFPLGATITGSAILSARPVVISDLETDSRIPPEARTPDLVGSLLVVPIRQTSPIGAIAINWAQRHEPGDEDIVLLQALADVTSVAWENVRLFNDLQDKIKGLEAQQVRIQAQHESLEVFSRALAHDLKEPVRTMRAFSELIATGEDPPDMRATYFELIRRAADRMGMLIDTVYQYTQLDNPSRVVMRSCDMGQIFRAATDNLAHLIRERDGEVTAGPLPVIDAHAAHMMQVMQNLLANAIRHGPAGVKVRVEADDAGDSWRFSVVDNGPGVDARDVERIFQPFKRLNLNEEGAGLGLAICRKVMTLHNGRIWCEPSSEGGRFLFNLAKAGAAAQPAFTAADHDKAYMTTPGFRLANVLLVDDREADVELTRVLLQVRDRLRFNLHIAHGGREALEMLRRTAERGEAIDLMLLDINMPGMSGFEMLEELRQDSGLRDTTVVMCSGSTYHDDLSRAQALGAAGYMVKPPSLEQLKPMLATMPDLHLQQDGADNRLVRAA